MPTARFWRIVGVEAYGGGDLELSELQAYGVSGRVDAAAVLTSSHAPSGGALSDLHDGSTSVGCRFAGDSVRSAGFWLAWDMGSAVEVVALRPGSASQRALYLRRLTLQCWDGVQWFTVATLGQFVYPGAWVMDLAPAPGDLHYAGVSLCLNVQGVHGSTVIVDSGPGSRAPISVGNASLSDMQSPVAGGTSMRITSSGAQLRYATGAHWYPSAGAAFTAEAFIYLPGVSGRHSIFSNYQDATHGWELVVNNGQLACNLRGDGYSLSGGVIPPSTWVHVALSGLEGSWRIFVQGVPVAHFTGASDLTSTEDFSVGGLIYRGAWYDLFDGFICGARITRSVSPRYVAGFIPPALPLPSAAAAGGQQFMGFDVMSSAVSVPGWAASAPVAAHVLLQGGGISMARDVEHGGAGTIYGTTKTKGTPNLPIKARVVLLHQRSKLPVRETWSDPITGAFAFTGIDTTQQFLTLAEDAAGNFRPVAASRLVPEVLP